MTRAFPWISQKQCFIVTSFDDSTSSLSREPRVEVTIKHRFWLNGWTSTAGTTYRRSQGSTKSSRSVHWTFSNTISDPWKGSQLKALSSGHTYRNSKLLYTFEKNMLNLVTWLTWIKTGILIKCVIDSCLLSISTMHSC